MESQIEQGNERYKLRLIATNCVVGACPTVYEVVDSNCIIGGCPGIYAKKGKADTEPQKYVIVGRQLRIEELQESGLAEKVGQGESAVEIPLDLIRRVLA